MVKADKFKLLQKPGGIIALLDEAWLACFPFLLDIPVILVLEFLMITKDLLLTLILV